VNAAFQQFVKQGEDVRDDVEERESDKDKEVTFKDPQDDVFI